MTTCPERVEASAFDVAQTIRDLRLARGLTIRDVEMTGAVSKNQVRDCETGRTNRLLTTLSEYARELGYDVSIAFTKATDDITAHPEGNGTVLGELPRDVVLHGDSAAVLRTLPRESIDLTVTSPPYDNMRQYQGGDAWDLAETVAQLWRVTKRGGVVVWVVADATLKGSETCSSFMQALAFRDVGFNLHDTMIWRKPNALPQNHNRYEPEFEYMFVFSKGKPKTFDGIRVPCLGAGSEEDWGRRADGEQVGEIGDVYARRARDDAEPRTTKADKLHGNVFEYPVGGNGPGRTWRHPAPFPYALARDHIVTWSREGDAVLDCFCGSGTTLEAARNLNRSFVGIELSERYAKMSAKRVGCEAIDVPSADIS